MRAAAALALAGLLLSGCADGASPSEEPSTYASTAPAPTTTTVPPAPAPSGPTSAPAPLATVGTAAAALATLPVKGRAPRTGYDRGRFGQPWRDLDRNGCDTRNDVLRRDLRRFVLKTGTRGCLVLRGRLADPYTGRGLAFVRGMRSSQAVQIDHVVALSDAWQKGAQQWTPAKRERLANDPLGLLAVDGPTNGSKSDGDAATWLPPRRSYRCAYVARQVAVKRKYGLWVTAAERDAIARVLARCPGQRLPTARVIALGGGPERSAPAARAPATTGTPRASTYENCTAVRAAGADPIRRGDRGFGDHLDRDGDGVACE